MYMHACMYIYFCALLAMPTQVLITNPVLVAACDQRLIIVPNYGSSIYINGLNKLDFRSQEAT